MPSHFNGKRFFLTYSQHESSKEEMLDFFKSLAPIKYYLIAEEQHQDEGMHFHCAIEFVSTQRGNSRWLDHDGKHPNVQSPRSWNAVKTYCKKDGNYIESECAVVEDLVAVVQSASEAEWMSYCVTNRLSFQYARWYWDRYANDFTTVTDDTDIQGNMCSAVRSMAYEADRKALIINGPTGCGKTTWAKTHAPKPALFVSHIDQLKKFVSGYHKSIIFDDVSIAHYPRDGQIHILDYDNPRAIHCRHTVAMIPAGVHKIFTCNDWPVTRGDGAIERRCKFVNIRILAAAGQ